jgi:hypothetical protein
VFPFSGKVTVFYLKEEKKIYAEVIRSIKNESSVHDDVKKEKEIHGGRC